MIAVLPNPWQTWTFSSSILISFLGIAFSVHGQMLFYSAGSFSCAPVAHWDAYRCGSSRCISWYQIQLILYFVLCPPPHCFVGQLSHWTAVILDSGRFLECHLVRGFRQLTRAWTPPPKKTAGNVLRDLMWVMTILACTTKVQKPLAPCLHGNVWHPLYHDACPRDSGG